MKNNQKCEGCQKYISHYCCWEQEDLPDCGIPIEKHLRCCLCNCKQEINEVSETVEEPPILDPVTGKFNYLNSKLKEECKEHICPLDRGCFECVKNAMDKVDTLHPQESKKKGWEELEAEFDKEMLDFLNRE